MSKSIDWGGDNINKLYVKILMPTLLSMVLVIAVTITDGFFVGRYVGSDALAAINISTPLFRLSTGVALMFGIGCSVVASVFMAKGDVRSANVRITQTFLVSIILFTILSLSVYFNSERVSVMLGSTTRLLPLVDVYVRIVSISLIFYMIQNIGLFIIRLDGSPRMAMVCVLIPTSLNIIADYLLIAHYGMGIRGAVIATAGSIILAGSMVMVYILFFSDKLKICRLHLTRGWFTHGVRNILYMCRLGSAAFLGDIATALMMFVGNHIFLQHYGEDGIAAFSIICYYFPSIFMINNAISQSAQPIISYNHGAGDRLRSMWGFRLTLIYGVGFALVMTLAVWLFSSEMVGLFLSSSSPAYQLAEYGMPLFSLGYTFFAINIMFMGYYQSIEDYKMANSISILRGYILLLIMFYAMPALLGEKGIWLAIPTVETLTTITILAIYYHRKRLPHKRAARLLI